MRGVFRATCAGDTCKNLGALCSTAGGATGTAQQQGAPSQPHLGAPSPILLPWAAPRREPPHACPALRQWWVEVAAADLATPPRAGGILYTGLAGYSSGL